MIRTLLGALIVCGFCLQGVASADTVAKSEASDADLTDRVVRQLSVSDRDIARRVHVSADNGVVTLEASGLTGAQASKVLVQVRAVPGVTKIENRLHLLM